MESEGRGSWEPRPEEQSAQLITINDAKARFLRDAELGRRLGESTLKKYRLMLKHLEEFAAKEGFVYLKQFDVEALRDFRDSWKLSPRTALKKLERVKAFFRFSAENNWISSNPAKVVRGPKNIHDTHKLPFEPDEMSRIIDACDQVCIQNFSNDEVRAFVLLLRYSGLRIGDASMLTIDRFNDDDLYLYTRKSGTHVYVPLPPSVMNTIRGIKLRQGKYLFTGPESLRMETASDLWRRKLGHVFRAAQIPGAHPHRFRHTFAVELLKKGVPMEEVSVLLGHSSVRITERHLEGACREDLGKLRDHRRRQGEKQVIRPPMDLETSLVRCKEGESETLEFKKSSGQLPRVGETLCAFLNGHGGAVLIGVAPDGRVLGQAVSDGTLQDIAQMLPEAPALEGKLLPSGARQTSGLLQNRQSTSKS
jgi:integrase